MTWEPRDVYDGEKIVTTALKSVNGGALWTDGTAVFIGNPDLGSHDRFPYIAIRKMGNGDSYTFQLFWREVTSFTVGREELHEALDNLMDTFWGTFA